jgi:hypothetical protein
LAAPYLDADFSLMICVALLKWDESRWYGRRRWWLHRHDVAARRRCAALGFLQPTPQQVGIQFMHQRDRGNRHAWSLAGGHYFRFEFIRVSPPFAATQGGILVNSVHLSTYSLVDTMLPRLLRRFKMPSPGAYELTLDSLYDRQKRRRRGALCASGTRYPAETHKIVAEQCPSMDSNSSAADKIGQDFELLGRIGERTPISGYLRYVANGAVRVPPSLSTCSVAVCVLCSRFFLSFRAIRRC